MTWIHGLKSITGHLLAIRRRESVRLRTASVLGRLDDRLLADIGVARNRVAEIAREVAHTAVPVAPMAGLGRQGVLARLKNWRDKRAAVNELSLLDGRLLRDIGIEPGCVDDVVLAALSERSNRRASQSAVELSEAHRQHLVPAPVSANPHGPVRSGDRATFRADRVADVRALQARAANRNGSTKPRRAAAGM